MAAGGRHPPTARDPHLPHKTEAGAVALGISSPAEVEAAVARIRADMRRFDVDASVDRFLVGGEPALISRGRNFATLASK